MGKVPMTTFLFWNLMGNQEASWGKRVGNLQSHITQMAASFGVDVFMFAESAFELVDLVAALNQAARGPYCIPLSRNNRIQIITRFQPSALIEQFDSEDDRLTIRSLTTNTTELLLAVMHFQSRYPNWETTDQLLQATVVHQSIVENEDTLGHRRTVLVGDLNMNPFDPGLVGAQALHAVMTRDLAQAEERTVAGRRYGLFYNPMWGCFGDRTPGPPGTYFHSASKPVNQYWHMFDQVLLRPQLMDALDDLRILDTDGRAPLLTDRGRPRVSDASDHLPLLFRLNL